MKIFFYHTEDIQYIYSNWEKGIFPGHLLYGATHFKEYGIEIIMCQHREYRSRLAMMIDTARQVLFCKEKFDAIFATHYKGLEIIIMLRALGLYRRKIVVWHHQPIITPSQLWREWLGRIFYRGIDEMFFFSQRLYEESLQSRKARPERMHVGHWGPDLDFYDKIINTVEKKDVNESVEQHKFISTGKERRDVRTLIEAFNATGEELEVFLSKTNCGINYEEMLSTMDIKDNIHIHFTSGLLHDKLCLLVRRSFCVVICCLETKYTVGLTSVVEALGLGMPVIISRNVKIPIDFDKEGCGITVDYSDTQGWIDAIKYIAAHPDKAAEMGRKARRLAEDRFNDRICAAEVATVLKKVVGKTFT